MRYQPLKSSFFSANRMKLAGKLKPGSIALLFSNLQMPRNGDQYYPYRQHSDFYYLTGIEQEKSILLLAPDAPSGDQKEILFILKSTALLETWEGHKLTPDEATTISGIANIRFVDEVNTVIKTLMPETEFVYFNQPEFPKFMPDVDSNDEINLRRFREKNPLYKYERLTPLLREQRIRKSDEEINYIRKAIEITGNAFIDILHTLKPGMKEFEIEALMTYCFLKNGANGHAYAPIVASGKNACILHYTENNNVCKDNDLLLMDFGAEYANYAADLSRTVPVNGTFTKRQYEIYNAVLRIMNFAKNIIKPGISINEFHAEVCKVAEEEHIKLGLYSQSDVKNHKGENPLWFNYYMHGTSHFLGLDVHDVGTKDTKLEPGMLITCEPGIYIHSENTGIRLENNLLITKDGNIDLMENIPIHPDEIESLMKGN